MVTMPISMPNPHIKNSHTMHNTDYKKNNLRIIFEAIGFKLDDSRKLSFPITKDVRNKLGISTQRFRQLLNNDENFPEISYTEISSLSNHFGCAPALLTKELPEYVTIEIQMAECNEIISEPA